jgi:hypothetical protein
LQSAWVGHATEADLSSIELILFGWIGKKKCADQNPTNSVPILSQNPTNQMQVQS